MPSPRLRILFVVLLVLSSSELLIYGQSNRRSRQRKTGSTVTTSESSKKPTTEPSPSAQTTTPYVSEEGQFKVTLPRGFTHLEKGEEQSAVTPYGEFIKVVTLEQKVKSGRAYDHCLVIYIDYPERIFREMSPAQIISSGQQGTLRNLPTPVTLGEGKFQWFPYTGLRVPTTRFWDSDFYSRLNFSQAPGLTTFISIKDSTGPHYMRFDIFLVKPRVYSIALTYQDRGKFDEDDVKTFFDSFRLIKAK